LEFSSTGDTQFPGSNSITAPSGLPPAPAASAYQDRSTGLLIFGIIEILGGVLTFLLIPLMLLGLVMSRKSGGGVPLNSAVTLPLVYGGLATMLLVLGIGATQAKRWAWALNVILSWIWLVAGAVITVMLVAVLPGSMLTGMKEAAARNPNPAVPSTTVMAIILTVMIVFMAVFLIVLPIAFLLFYRSKNVELTCKHRDPQERWTDRIPLPIIAYGLLISFGAVYNSVAAFSRPLFPLFGRYLTGVPAGSLLFAFAIVDVIVAVLFFRIKVAGWWLAVLTLGLRMVSAVVTSMRGNLMEAYSRLGWSSRQLEQMSRSPFGHGYFLVLWTLAILIPYFALLLWTKRYFRASDSASYTESAGPLANQIASGS
jgi:hypothetical protein